MDNNFLKYFSALLLLAALQAVHAGEQHGPGVSVEPLAGEKHFKNLRQLIFGTHIITFL